MTEFNQLDVIILITLAFGVINGFFKGFISQIIGIVGFFIAIWISFKFYSIVEEFIEKHNIVSASLTSIIALLLTFAIAFFTIKFVSSLTQKFISAIGLGFLNRIGGAIMGFILYTLISSSILYYIDPILELGFKNVKQESKVLPFLTKSSGMIKSLFFETKENVSKENSEKSI